MLLEGYELMRKCLGLGSKPERDMDVVWGYGHMQKRVRDSARTPSILCFRMLLEGYGRMRKCSGLGLNPKKGIRMSIGGYGHLRKFYALGAYPEYPAFSDVVGVA